MTKEHQGLDDLARLLTAAAGLAKGMEREVEDALRRRFERWRGEEDSASREEREATMAMARLARQENERLREQLAALQTRVERLEGQRQDKPGGTP